MARFFVQTHNHVALLHPDFLQVGTTGQSEGTGAAVWMEVNIPQN